MCCIVLGLRTSRPHLEDMLTQFQDGNDKTEGELMDEAFLRSGALKAQQNVVFLECLCGNLGPNILQV